MGDQVRAWNVTDCTGETVTVFAVSPGEAQAAAVDVLPGHVVAVGHGG